MKRVALFQPISLAKYFYTQTIPSVRYACSSKAVSPGNAGLPKAQKISQAMKIYLEKSQAHNNLMREELHEFEVGKRYLANMMGLNPDNITQTDIDEAIEYLLPSGLFDKKARPKMKHPSEIMPKRKAVQFGLDGRPFNTFFYTSKQNYAELLHKISLKMEELKEIEDKQDTRASSDNLVELKGSEWLGLDKVNQLIEEKLLEPEYKTVVSALDQLSRMPHSNVHKDFVFNFRLDLKQQSRFYLFQIKEAQKDKDGKLFYEDIGKRKKGRAMVQLYEKGTGQVTVNEKLLIEHFPKLTDRAQVLFPLHLMGLLGKVDVQAQVEGGGSSGQAGAIRLALARCLQNIVTEEERKKLKLAGLLTSDPRTVERQKPGKRGARRGYTWKKR